MQDEAAGTPADITAQDPAVAPVAAEATQPDVDHFNGEDVERWETLCQQRIDDTYAKKVRERTRTTEARNLHEANEYDLTGAGATEDGAQLYFKQSKILVTAIVAALVENGFDIKVKADPPPWAQDPELLALADDYAARFGLPEGDRSGAVSELLTHGESTINEQHHLPILLQKWLEAALVDGPGVSYCYTGVSPFSPHVVVKEYVPADQMWVDIHATDFYSAQWHCRFWPATLEQRIARFPEFKEYFEENDQGDPQGQSPAAEKNSSSQFAMGYIQQHLFRNWEMEDDGQGGMKPKYPGFYTVVWRHNNQILKIEPLQFLHEESPYDQLVGVTRQDSPEGMSFVLDILYGFVMAENRLINAAIETAETIGRGKRLLQIDALENPDDAYDNSISNLLVRPGFNLTEVVYNLVGADVSPAIRGALDILQSRFPQLVGDKPRDAAQGATGAPDNMKAGYSQAPLRARIRDFLARIAKKDVFNLIQFDYQTRAFKASGAVGAGVVRYPPAVFQPLIDNTEAYFTIEVQDKKAGGVDAIQQADITAKMIDLARKAMEADPGLSYSKALEMGPEFEEKDRMVRMARINEAERKRAAQAAKAAGQPDPAQAAVALKNKASRGEDLSEVAKRVLQDLSGKYPEAAAVMLMSGGASNFFKVAQEEMPPLTKEQSDEVLALLGMVPALETGKKPQKTPVTGVPGAPTVLPGQQPQTGAQALGATA
jgi:hypothetical protein